MYCKNCAKNIVKVCLVIFVLVCVSIFFENKVPNCEFSQVMAKETAKTLWDDSTPTVDFTPYIKDLQAKIKKNWNPSNDNKSNGVVLSLKIANDGSLLSSDIVKSSGSAKTDNEALQAVQKSAPFSPLPSEFTGESVDIQFSLDYTNRGRIGQRYKKDYLQY